jgi:hypothetical protein
MNALLSHLEYQIQGSTAERYVVRFWREGANLHSSCTCQAGHRGLSCKHRISLLQGDVTDLLDSSPSKFSQLSGLVNGSDVAQAIAVYDGIGDITAIGAALLPLKPPGRRKSISPEVAVVALANGGLAKGNTIYFDVYDEHLLYLGSVKVRKGTVFSEQAADYFPGASLAVRRITDALVWERSQSVYAADPHSASGRFLLSDDAHKEALRKLKKAVAD